MTFKLPTRDKLRELAESLGMDIDDGNAEALLNYLVPFAGAYNAIGSLTDASMNIRYPRTPGYRPEGDENKHGAWYVKTTIPGASKGPLAGKKVAVKDTVCLAGVPMMNGASVLEGYVPDVDATIVTRLLDAGATIVGKSVCEYFSISGGSATSASGIVQSPRNPGHTPGGSSTGSGALVAAGEVDMATGGDQAGSIRIPASMSGVVGIKPTFGLVPYTGIMGMDPTIDHAGPLTGNVADNALFLEVLAGDDGLDPRQRNVKTAPYTKGLDQGAKGLRIAVVKEGFGRHDSDPDVDECVRNAAALLGKKGATVEEISIPWHPLGLAIWSPIALEGCYRLMYSDYGLGRYAEGLYVGSLGRAMAALRSRGNELPYTMKVAMLLGAYADSQYAGHYYAKAQNLRRRLRASYDEVLGTFDLLLMPTTPMMTSPIPPTDAPLEAVMKHCWEMIGNTSPFNVTGHPAISVPCGLGSGDRPIGMMLVARHFNEATLYRGAYAFEQSGNWEDRRPTRRK